MKKMSQFLSKNVHFLVINFSVYLNRHVFVMICAATSDNKPSDMCATNKRKRSDICAERTLKSAKFITTLYHI